MLNRHVSLRLCLQLANFQQTRAESSGISWHAKDTYLCKSQVANEDALVICMGTEVRVRKCRRRGSGLSPADKMSMTVACVTQCKFHANFHTNSHRDSRAALLSRLLRFLGAPAAVGTQGAGHHAGQGRRAEEAVAARVWLLGLQPQRRCSFLLPAFRQPLQPPLLQQPALVVELSMLLTPEAAAWLPAAAAAACAGGVTAAGGAAAAAAAIIAAAARAANRTLYNKDKPQ